MVDVKIKQCFKIYSNEIEDRLDPLYLQNIILVRKVNSKYPLVPLEKLLKTDVQYGANEIAVSGNPERDVRYIRITDIDDFGNLKNDEWKTAKKTEDKYILEEGDILFARSGATVGKNFIYTNGIGKAIFAGYLIRFKFNDKKVNPFYIFYYTKLNRYNFWVKSIQRPSGQPNINSKEFKSFEIPLPPLKIQNQIVEIMQKAYLEKEKKEREAEKIFNSIDDYILGELGIKASDIKDKECFGVRSEELANNRLDPYYYQPKFEEVIKLLKKSKYKVNILKNIATKIISGQRPKGGVGQIKAGIPSLGGEHILSNGLVKTEELKFIPIDYHNDHKESKINKKDILLVKDGATTGKVGIVPQDYPHREANINEHLFLIRCKNDINPYFLFSFLKSFFGQSQLEREITGGTVTGIIRESIENIKIPIPPIKTQNDIASNVLDMMNQSEKLRAEAKQILEKAKSKIEQIILS